ncbi:upf0764 protein c16orf89 homolog [Plakobranchus ocellatus]|uniref:Upf0764 protein c16orf89 homolog n=1 Tax=Plakobranchus ocellatus TaxID=259542 RepID=A0AAV4CID6_9GAST|nr:upf0764 protein c16orf89 homolog [Plakobranchus ocellatus]
MHWRKQFHKNGLWSVRALTLMELMNMAFIIPCQRKFLLMPCHYKVSSGLLALVKPDANDELGPITKKSMQAYKGSSQGFAPPKFTMRTETCIIAKAKDSQPCHLPLIPQPPTMNFRSGAITSSTSSAIKHLKLHEASARAHPLLLSMLILLLTIAVFPATKGLHLSGGQSLDPDVWAESLLEPMSPPATNSTMDLLLRTFDGLGKALQFFKSEFRHVNLDAVIGTRIVQSSLDVLLRRLANFNLLDDVPPYVINHIRKLRDEAGEVSDLATPYIMMNEPQYYGHIGPILSENRFALDYDNRDINEDAPVWEYNRVEVMEESFSDDCLAELFGTKTGKTCDISRNCWKAMTGLGYNRYSLSHEIFYLELAETSGCRSEMQWYILQEQQGSLQVLHDTFCANMLAEANLIADNNFPAEVRDVFMEQAALCGMLGYRQFFTSDWLVKILSWQDQTNGCYRWAGWPEKSDEDAVSKLVVPRSNGRLAKREEKRIAEGCLCHRTSVAASALSQYVRFILEVWFDEQLF